MRHFFSDKFRATQSYKRQIFAARIFVHQFLSRRFFFALFSARIFLQKNSESKNSQYFLRGNFGTKNIAANFLRQIFTVFSYNTSEKIEFKSESYSKSSSPYNAPRGSLPVLSASSNDFSARTAPIANPSRLRAVWRISIVSAGPSKITL